MISTDFFTCFRSHIFFCAKPTLTKKKVCLKKKSRNFITVYCFAVRGKLNGENLTEILYNFFKDKYIHTLKQLKNDFKLRLKKKLIF